jgi:ribonuclease Z
VPYVLSQRTRHQGAATRVFCPAETVEDLEALIRASGRLEATEYDYRLTGLTAGDRVSVGRDLTVEAFPTDHVLPSLGYHLIRTKHRLRPEHRGRPGPELARLRAEGVETEERIEELALTFCGDTGAGVFELEPRVFQALILLLECTFLGEDRRAEAALYKHLHLDDLVARSERFENRALVLHHLSRRYRPAQLRAEVDRRLPDLSGRIQVLGEDGEGGR